MTFRSPSATLNKEEIQKQINEIFGRAKIFSSCRKELIQTKVSVKVMDIRWLIVDGKVFVDLVPALQDCD